MPTASTLRTALEVAAKALGDVAPDLGGKATKGKAYEVWVLLEIALELAHQGVPVSAVDHAGRPARVLRVRGSPTGMPSAASASGNEPGHLVLGRNGRHELHLGLEHHGAAGATHEIDIALLPGPPARHLRRSGGSYPGAPLLAIELKAHDASPRLDQGIPRALVGVMTDLDPSWVVEYLMVANRSGRWSRAYRPGRPQCAGALVTSTRLYDNSCRLLGEYAVEICEEVEPGRAADSVRALANLCRSWTG